MVHVLFFFFFFLLGATEVHRFDIILFNFHFPLVAQMVTNLSTIPGSGKYPGEGNGYPLQYSCLGNPKDREA